MSFDPIAVDLARALRAAPERPAAPAAARDAGLGAADPYGPAARVDAIPASPPPELAAEVLAAQRVVADLHDRGRELHFAMVGGRVRIELRDLDGNVLRRIPPTEALEIAAGKAVE